MALSMRERQAIRREITAYMEKIEADENMPFRERASIRKQIAAELEKLEEQIDLNPEAAEQNEKLRKLIAGDYDNLAIGPYIKMLETIHGEIGEVDSMKPPVMRYIKKNKNKAAMVMEAAMILEASDHWKKQPRNDIGQWRGGSGGGSGGSSAGGGRRSGSGGSSGGDTSKGPEQAPPGLLKSFMNALAGLKLSDAIKDMVGTAVFGPGWSAFKEVSGAVKDEK